MATLQTSVLRIRGFLGAARLVLGVLAAATLAGCAGQQATQTTGREPAAAPSAGEVRQARELVEKARLTIDGFDFGPDNQQFLDMIKRAKGVLIFPSTFRAAFIVGGQGGSGVFLVRDEKAGRWNGPAFYTLGGASVGFQAGAEVSEVVALAMTERGMTRLLSPTVTLGGDVTVAAGPVGAGVAGATAGLSADIVSYARSKGAYGGVSLQGGVLTNRNDLNHAYYGQPVTPTDILVRGVQNPEAAPLISAVSRVAGAPVAIGR
jgi:SH3 domain-containing YSC84-like protein 1